MKPEEEQRLQRLLELDRALQNEQPDRKADALRNLIFEARFAAKIKDDSAEEPYAAAFFQEQYEKIVDGVDPKTGLNTFFAGAFALCEKGRNERDQWKSSLDENTITSVPSVKNFIERCKLQSQRMTPKTDVSPWQPNTDAAATFRKPLFKPSTSQPGQPLFNVKAAASQSDSTSETGFGYAPKYEKFAENISIDLQLRPVNAARKPGPSWSVSESTTPQPQPSWSVSESTTPQPQPSWSVSESTTPQPRPSWSMSESTTPQPRPSWSVSESTTPQPRPSWSMSESTTPQPQPSWSVSESTTPQPRPSWSMSESTTPQPRPSWSMSESTTPQPRPSWSVSESTTPQPRPSWSVSESTTSQPRPSWSVSGSATPQPRPSCPTAAFSSVGKAGKRCFREASYGGDEDGEGNDIADNNLPDSSRNVPRSEFRTAKEQFVIDQRKKTGQDRSQSNFLYGSNKKSLGTRRGPSNKFIPPVLNRENDSDTGSSYRSTTRGPSGGRSNEPEEPVDERLKGIEPKIVELITNEIMDHRPEMDWEDIAGLQFAKNTIKEIVVWPMLRPDIFTGLRGPPKGLLLFGPPGTGKTLIGKCIASQSKSTFFCISASSLTSKWVGEGEKMVRALFAVARCHQPAVIFIDEVDSLLSQRSDGEHEASRRIKTEFLVQLDGATTESEDRILVIGATNRPQEIDEAARRRFVKRLYIPLPDLSAREHIIQRLMSAQHCQLSDVDISAVAERTEGYSGADMANLCREAALGPIRSIPFEQMETIRPDQVPPITRKDFETALPQVRPSVSEKDLDVYITWNNTYGSFGQGAGV